MIFWSPYEMDNNRWNLRKIQMGERKDKINQEKRTFLILLETVQMAINTHSENKTQEKKKKKIQTGVLCVTSDIALSFLVLMPFSTIFCQEQMICCWYQPTLCRKIDKISTVSSIAHKISLHFYILLNWSDSGKKNLRGKCNKFPQSEKLYFLLKQVAQDISKF